MSAPAEPGDGLDPALTDPTRLSIVALLGPASWVEFGFVCEKLGISKSALSKQATSLERTGHITVRKGYVGKRPRTWLQLAPAGRMRMQQHVAALTRIAEQSAAAHGPV